MPGLDDLPSGDATVPVTRQSRKDIVDALLGAQERAATRLLHYNPTGTFAAIAGIELEQDELALGEHVSLRRLVERPRVTGSEVTRSLPVMHELHFAVPADHGLKPWTADVLWTIVALLRASTSGLFVVTELSNRSWDVVDALALDGVVTQPLNIAIPPWFTSAAPVRVGMPEGDWVGKYWVDVLDLRKSHAFHFMIECFETSFVEVDMRMAITKVWAGIEVFIGASTEIRFRLSLLLAATLEAPGDDRYAFYKRLQKLYDVRSRVVHGSAVKPTVLQQHLEEARSVLGRLVRFVVERGGMPTVEALERRLLA